MSPGFDHLSKYFAEDELLGKVLRANHNPIGALFTTADRQNEQQNQQKNQR
jgi:hypothetical protein